MATKKIEGPAIAPPTQPANIYVPQTGDAWAALLRGLDEKKALAQRQREQEAQFELLDKGHKNDLERMKEAAYWNKVEGDNQLTRQKDVLKYGHDLDEEARQKQLNDMTYGAQLKRQGAALTGNPNIGVDSAYKLLNDFSSRLALDAAKRQGEVTTEVSKYRHREALNENMAELASDAMLARLVEARKVTNEQVVQTILKKRNEAEKRVLNMKNIHQTSLGAGKGSVDALVTAANAAGPKAAPPTVPPSAPPTPTWRKEAAAARVGGTPPSTIPQAAPTIDGLLAQVDSHLAGMGVSPKLSPQEQSTQAWRLLKENVFDRYGDRYGNEQYTQLAKLLFDAQDRGLTPEQLRGMSEFQPILNTANGDVVTALRAYMVGALSELRQRTTPNADFTLATKQVHEEDQAGAADARKVASQAPQNLKINDVALARSLDQALTRMVTIATPVASNSLSKYSRDLANGNLMLEKAKTNYNTEELLKAYQSTKTERNLTQAYANAQFTEFKDDPDFLAIMESVPPETKARVMTDGATIHGILRDSEVMEARSKAMRGSLQTGADRLSREAQAVEAPESTVKSGVEDILDTGVDERIPEFQPIDFTSAMEGLSPEGLASLEATMNTHRPPTLLDTATREILSAPETEDYMKSGFALPDIWGKDTVPNLNDSYVQQRASETAKQMMTQKPQTISPGQVNVPGGSQAGRTKGLSGGGGMPSPQGPSPMQGPRGPQGPTPMQAPQSIGGPQGPRQSPMLPPMPGVPQLGDRFGQPGQPPAPQPPQAPPNPWGQPMPTQLPPTNEDNFWR